MEIKKHKKTPAKFTQKVVINSTFDDVLKVFSQAAHKKNKEKVATLQKG